jgi:hypothetical protein
MQKQALDCLMTTLKSPEETKLWLQDQDIIGADFSRDHDLNQATTYQVLSGRKKLTRQSS